MLQFEDEPAENKSHQLLVNKTFCHYLVLTNVAWVSCRPVSLVHYYSPPYRLCVSYHTVYVVPHAMLPVTLVKMSGLPFSLPIPIDSIHIERISRLDSLHGRLIKRLQFTVFERR